MIWTSPWPDEKDLFFEVPYSRNFVWNTKFFLHKLYQKILLFQTLVSQGILHAEIGLVWITSWPFQKDLFLKLFFGNNRKFPYETLTFFYASHCEFFFVLTSRYTLDTSFRVWCDLDKSLTRWKGPIFWSSLFAKFVYIREVPYENLTFFPDKPYPKNLFVSDSRCTGDTPYRVLFDLDKSLIRWKKPVLKFVIREIRKFPYEILIFFVHKLY